MALTFLYYHRLDFPSASGQTIQVLRDYRALVEFGHAVHLFYRASAPLTAEALTEALAAYGTPPHPRFQLHAIAPGRGGSARLHAAAQGVLDATAGTAVVVTRTVDHALRAQRLLAPDLWRLHELHETALPHLVYAEQGRALRAWWSRRREARVFRAVHGLIATVGSQCTLLERLFPAHAPVVVLPNGVALAGFGGVAERPRDGAYHLRYAGQLSGWKGTDLMIEALRELPPHVVLDIAGGRPSERAATEALLAATAAHYGVSARVVYHGFLPPVAVPRFLQGADALLLPLGDNVLARHFTSPMKLFEYAASGVPMVVARQPTTESLVQDGREALMFAPGSATGLAQAVTRLMREPALAAALATRARAWVAPFAYDERARRYVAFVQGLARNP